MSQVDYEEILTSRRAKVNARKKDRIATIDIKPCLAVNPSLLTFNLIKSDSYKGSHGLMLTDVFSENPVINTQFYVSARKGSKFSTVINFGLQYILEMLENTIITEDHVLSVSKLYDQGIGSFDTEGWLYVARECKGIMPLKISALPEGVEVPVGVPLFTMESTDPKFAMLVGYLETFMSHLWYPLTVCTQSREIKKIIQQYFDETSTDPGAINFMLHDFGCRGTSSMSTSGVGGAAHLVNFMGSDTIPGLQHIFNHYGCSTMPGFSVNATEHSIMTSMGEAGEFIVLEKVLKKFPSGVLSLVIDSYDQYRATEMLTTQFLPIIKAREGKLMLRPDSGEPVDVVKRLLSILSKNISDDIRTNDKGYKVLPSYIGIIYGDGLSPSKITTLLITMKELGWAADNIVFGMGGGLLQKVDRDTCRFAWKCCALQTADGLWRDVYKDPCDGKGTDDSKASLKGKQKVIKIDGVYTVVREDCVEYESIKNELEVVYLNGDILKTYTFDEIRANASL